MNAPVLPPRTAAEAGLAELFARHWATLPGGAAVAAQRAAAFRGLEAAGLPSARAEAWKYTDLKRLMRAASPLPPASVATAGALLAGLGLRRLAVIDGRLRPELSDFAALEPGLSLRTVAQALAADEPLLEAATGDPLAALNAAFAADGLDMAVQGVLARPIHLSFTATGPWGAFSRSRLRLGPNARATLVETYEGQEAASQTSSTLCLDLAPGAQLEHIRVQREGACALHLAQLRARLDAGAQYRQTALDLGAGIARSELHIDIVGEGAGFVLGKAALLAGAAHADTTVNLRHAAVGATSRELYKAVVDGSARSVFQGRIAVAEGAQQTDARMMARALLLSDEARADCKPELEIFADDVQCGHGATIGGLDPEQRFYLMARGLPPRDADAILIEAFAREPLDGVADEALREALGRLISDWLDARN